MNKLYVVSTAQMQEAQNLAAFTNGLDIVTIAPTEELYLRLDIDGLCLIMPRNAGFMQQFQPLYIRDIYAKLYLRKDQLAKEMLIRAVKVKPAPDLLIIDATAGLAKDALLLALYGYKVLMLEQNPLLATIVYYALLNKLLPTDNLQLVFGNSINYLKNNLDLNPYAIYLDPMFVSPGKSLAKKEMQIIQMLTKNQESSDSELFMAAYLLAKKVIVKRDSKQQSLVSTPLPSHSNKGKTIRYDIYFRSLEV